MPKKIFLNAYLHKNLGDDLFLYIFQNRYNHHQIITITNHKIYKEQFPSLKVIDNPFFIKVIRKCHLHGLIANKCDVVVTLGGSMFIEASSNDKNKKFKIGKRPFFVLGCNFGPYQSHQYYENVKGYFQDAQDVCFRDLYSYHLFKDLPQMRQAPDIVFSLPTNQIQIKQKQRVIFSLISCQYKSLSQYDNIYKKKVIEMITFFQEKNYEIILMSFCQYERDEEIIESIMNDIQDKHHINKYYYDGNINQALDILGSSEIIVASRFHANILGLLLEKTIIPLYYSDKTLHVLNDLGFEGLMIDIKELKDFHLDSFTQEVLEYHLKIDDIKNKALEHFLKLDQFLGD